MGAKSKIQKQMKYLILILLFSSCTRNWTVIGYSRNEKDYKGLYEVKCKSGKKIKTFLIECKPDSIGVKFKY